MRMALALLLAAGAACKDEEGAADGAVTGADAGAVVDAAPPAGCDAAPVFPTCGCTGAPTCVSLDVYDWTERRRLGPDDGLTAHLVTELDYGVNASPLATAVPDAMGRVVFEGFTPPPGLRLLVALDDSPGATEDRWSPTAVGPIAAPGVSECVPAPAVTRARGDTYLTDLGFPPGEGILGGSVILELRDLCGELVDGIAVETRPEGITMYFSDDREHLGYAAGTGASGAALTVASTYCSPFCLNLGCSCGDPECGPRADLGGVGNGFLFFTMACDPP